MIKMKKKALALLLAVTLALSFSAPVLAVGTESPETAYAQGEPSTAENAASAVPAQNPVLPELFADGDVAINESNFPDPVFRGWVMEEYGDGDSTLTADEITNTTSIDLSDLGIADLKGIKFFTALQDLWCSNSDPAAPNNTLTALNVSGLDSLKNLYCSGNANLTTLDASDCGTLDTLNCAGSALTGLNLSGSTHIRFLSCGLNDLTELDVSDLGILQTLYCEGNALTALDVSQNTGLSRLNCENNGLTELDLSLNAELNSLYCEGNPLQSLTLPGGRTLMLTVAPAGAGTVSVTEITGVNQPTQEVTLTATAEYGYTFNRWTDAAGNGGELATTEFTLSENMIMIAQFSEDPAAVYHPGDVAAVNRMIQNNHLDWTASAPDSWPTTGNPSVTWSGDETGKRITLLSVDGMGLTGTLDVSGLDALKTLYCNENSLTGTLDVSALANLEILGCYDNGLTALNVSGLANMIRLDCYENNLTALDLSGLDNLYTLYCYNNPFRSLKLPDGEELTVDISPADSGTVMFSHDNRTDLTDNKTITLTATPATGYKFDGWTGSASGSGNPANLTLSGNQAVTANFSEDLTAGYHPGDVAVINGIIQNSNLDRVLWAENNPGRWPTNTDELSHIEWNNETPKRVTGLFLNNAGLTGTLDVSALAELQRLGCVSNGLTELNVSGLANLKNLSCDDNNLTSLDVSDCDALQFLWCQYNDMTALNVSGLDSLTDLQCEYNDLTALDVSNNAALERLYCHDNPFQSLKLPTGETLTVNVNPANSGTVLFSHDSSNSLITNKTITLTATANPENTFTGWLGDASGSDNPLMLTLEGDKSVTAVFRDSTPPTGEIRIKTNAFTSFLNTVTFGLFFKDTADVTVSGSDGESGVKAVEYLASADALPDTTDWISLTWIPIENGGTFSLSANQKGYVYARITDNADNVTVLRSDGVVVYTDSEGTVDGGSFSKGSPDDLTVAVNMNGNTVKEIKNGSATLTAGTDYTEDEDSVTFKNTYLKSLADGTANFTVSYDPGGEVYVDADGNEAPGTTVISIGIGRATQNIYITGLGDSYTYGDGTVALSTGGGLGSGAVTYEVIDGEGVASVSGNTVTILKAGTFKIKATKAADAQYLEASYTSEAVTVSEATPAVTLNGENVTYGQNITLTATVTGAGATPTGTVTFKEGDTVLAADVALVNGTVSYTVTAPDAGNRDYSVVYSGQIGYYTSATGTKSVGVGLSDQEALSIIGKPATVTYGDGGFTLGTDGGSGNGVITFSVPNNDVVSITAGGAVTINNAGTVIVTAVKAGDNNYNAITAILEITVLPRDISLVTVTVTGSTVYTGNQLQPAFSVSDGTLAINTGDYNNEYGLNVTVAQGGSVTLTGKRNYTGTKTVNFDILKATPATIVFPTFAAVDYDPARTLADITLSGSGDGTFAWDDDTIIPTVDNSGYTVNFTPNDTENYDYTGVTLTAAVQLTVNKIDPAYTLPTPTATYGDTLASVTLPAGWTWEGMDSVGNAGAQTHKATFTPDDTNNYNTLTGIDVTVNVVRKDIAVPTANAGLVYDGTEQTGVTGGTGYSAAGNTATNAGMYTATVTPDSNHQWESGADVTAARTVQFVIAQKPITVTADDREKYFGADDPELTWTADPALTGGDTLTGSLKYEGADVGTYDIVQDAAFSNPNYDITFESGTMTIKRTPTMDEVIDMINALPDPVKDRDDADKVADATNAFDALPEDEKYQIPDDVKDKLEEAQHEAGEINHVDGDVTITDDDLPWYIRVIATLVPETDMRYPSFFGKLTDKKLLVLYEIRLINTLTGEDYDLPEGETVTVEISGVELNGERDIAIAHEKADGTIEVITAAAGDGKVTFTATDFSLYGVTATADKPTAPTDPSDSPKTGDDSNTTLWLLLGGASLAILVSMAITERKRKRYKIVKR